MKNQKETIFTRKSLNVSRFLVSMLLVAILFVASSCAAKTDDKNLLSKAMNNTNTQLQKEFKDIVGKNAFFVEYDKVMKAQSKSTITLPDSVGAMGFPTTITATNDPVNKVFSMYANMTAGDLGLYVNDEFVTLNLLGDIYKNSGATYFADLISWLGKNGVTEAQLGPEVSSLKDITMTYSGIMELSGNSALTEEDLKGLDYMGEFNKLLDISIFNSTDETITNGAEADIKVKKVSITFKQKEFETWYNELIAKIEADPQIDALFEKIALASTYNTSYSEVPTKEEFINSLKDFDYGNVQASKFNFYISNEKIIRFEIVDNEGVADAEYKVQLNLSNGKNLTDFIQFVGAGTGEVFDLSMAGNLIDDGNGINSLIKYTDGVTDEEINFTWNTAEKTADNVKVEYDGETISMFLGVLDGGGIKFDFSTLATESMGTDSKVSVEIAPSTEAVTIPEGTKSLFDTNLMELFTKFATAFGLY